MAGRRAWGIAFAGLELLGWVGLALWAAWSRSDSWVAVFLMAFILAIRAISLAHLGRLGAGLLILAGSLGGEWVLFLFLMRATVLEFYRIPSSAMEPTLLGNNTHQGCAYSEEHVTPDGDRILVSRLAYAVSPVQRFDLAVFRFPLNESRMFVKRVVGMPGEELILQGGDVFARARGAGEFRILRKPPEILWFRAFGREPLTTDSFSGVWKQGRGTYRIKEGVLESEPTQEFRYDRPLVEPGSQSIQDVRLAFEFQADGSGSTVHARLENGFGTVTVEIQPSQGFLNFAGPKGEKRLSLNARIEPGRWNSVDLSIRDGQASLDLNRTSFGLEFVSTLEEVKGRKETEAELAFGVRGGPVRIRELKVWQDVHYKARLSGDWEEGKALAIPEGAYVFLGDNVNSSHDSRSWVRKTFTLKDGRTIACENQEIENRSEFNPSSPEGIENPLWIQADTLGRGQWIDQDQVVSKTSEPFHFVERRFIRGKVMRVWWPPPREGPVQ
jgi:signal peptidase I